MSEPLRMAMVAEGNAESPDGAFSGSAWRILEQFRRLGHQVRTVDSELYGWRRVLLAGRTFGRNRTAWRARFHFGPHAVRARTRRAAVGLAPIASGTDVIFQFGATLNPPDLGIPYVLFCDWNMALTIRRAGSKWSEAQHIPAREAAEINAREAATYRGAAAVFTISERLRQSFIEDYGLSPERVVTAHAGANIDLASIPERPASRPGGQPPTVLFSSRVLFEQKGGDVLLAAFREVRRAIPDARLQLMGPSDVGPLDPGVELLGFLRKSVPSEHQRLVEAFLKADVFCLPTRYDAFGIVVVEAMAFGLPCVTSDIWALPEMVLDGKTGYTVPVGESGPLAERLIRLLRDPGLARSMGAAGRRHAEEHFTWSAAAQRMHEWLQANVARRT